MSEPSAPLPTFAELGLPESLLGTLAALGYETPTPIQRAALPVLLAGRDLLARAPTGTGKTAAFALPALARLADSGAAGGGGVRMLVLTPTRELAIQVAEAFKSYAARLPGFRVVPIYGGQDYGTQNRQLQRGVQVVVGTPGRVMDHLRRGTLTLDGLDTLVLDEADEMLRMGFIDDVDWILERTPATRQTALFSATMPKPIARIAEKHLRAPATVTIEARRERAADIRQRVWMVAGLHKLDALTRILEVERFDGMLIFVRTRTLTAELAEKLEARGFAATAINGDMPQSLREQTVERFKRGAIDILVATDVVARGIDVDRISHVINYDIPHDTEAYVHRIGRTGRAGRHGEAILFATPRERRLLGAIERATGSRIEPLTLPSVQDVNQRRVEDFKAAIDAALETEGLGRFEALVAEVAEARDVPMSRVAAALARLAAGDRPLYLRDATRDGRTVAAPTAARGSTPERAHAPKPDRAQPRAPEFAPEGRRRAAPLVAWRVAVGGDHGVQPQHLVGAIANEAGIGARLIGRIRIEADHSTVELPADLPKPILQRLRKAWVLGQRLDISAPSDVSPDRVPAGERPPKRTTKRVEERGPGSVPGAAAKPATGPGSGTSVADRPAKPRKKPKVRDKDKGKRKPKSGDGKDRKRASADVR